MRFLYVFVRFQGFQAPKDPGGRAFQHLLRLEQEQIRQEVRQVRQLFREAPATELPLIKRWGVNFVQHLGKDSCPAGLAAWKIHVARHPTRPERYHRALETSAETPRVGRGQRSWQALPRPWGPGSYILDFPGRELR